MNFFKSNIIFVSILLFSSLCAATAEYTIEKYNRERDEQAVIKILNDTPQYLRYESLGMPVGTTEQYINSPKYITAVLRLNGKTIGFVNYIAHSFEILTFHIMRFGLIHLMGVDKEYQGVGYGSILLNYAIDQLTELKCPTILLNAKESNIKARRIYEKAGFTAVLVGDDIIYSLKINIPASELPQGNIIQRYPWRSLVVATATLGGTYFAWQQIKILIDHLTGSKLLNDPA